MTAFINRIGTATPEHDIHQAFVSFAGESLPEGIRFFLVPRDP